jgi:hypothetical protein
VFALAGANGQQPHKSESNKPHHGTHVITEAMPVLDLGDYLKIAAADELPAKLEQIFT